jgi:putative transposase
LPEFAEFGGQYTQFLTLGLEARYDTRMGRIARVVAPGLPHHVTQRGNRRMETFFGDEDYAEYLKLLAQWCGRFEVVIWAYCLMPNHVHLVAVPETAHGLSHALGEAHRRYTRCVNFREGWRGHLWQERFASFVMDEQHLLAALRYVELNPVRAGLVACPGDYRWSSARAHLEGKDDLLVRVEPMLSYIGDWSAYLVLDVDEAEAEAAALRLHGRTGRPLGSADFIAGLETSLGRFLRKRRPGPRSKRKIN